ncbi:sporulation integral membrane protein YtvI [Anoxybacillus calidus]|jgi:sporulation integral membrane protein YtvI|uniref:Sporulation integral membrane protein YtvI n=1 Tax=[Anoxybacillus] calidus TaxID=575178 RepID=A0A7V9YWM5_9BACL|nr:sporulation integral membrane protein YtvI [Anoxybacillus calidus]MBA2869809.1 sporulation integral membrane protein YtvI [Anoxybacillus calidus]
MVKKFITLVVLLAILFYLIPYSLPLIFALITALLLEPFVQKMQQKYKFKRIHTVTTVFSLFVIVIGFASYVTIVIIIEQVITFSQKLPSVLSEFTVVVDQFIKKWELYSHSIPKEIIISLENSVEAIKNLLLNFAKNLTESIIHYITAIPGLIIHFLIYLIALFLISLDLPRLKKKIEKYLSADTKQRLTIIMTQLNKAGIGFLKAQFLLSLITFLLAFVGLLLLRVEYPIILSLLIVVVDILPILGTGSVLVPWAIFSLMNGNQGLGIGLIVLFIVITVIRRIIEPKIFSSNLGISPLAALVSVYLGFQLLGFAGLFLGPALVIIVDTMIKAGIIKISFKI